MFLKNEPTDLYYVLLRSKKYNKSPFGLSNQKLKPSGGHILDLTPIRPGAFKQSTPYGAIMPKKH